MSDPIEMGLDSVEPGMVLAEDLRNDAGQVLLSQGSELTEKSARGLSAGGWRGSWW